MYNDIFDNFLDDINGFNSFFKGVSSVKNDYNLVYGEFNKDSFCVAIDILRDFNFLNNNKKLIDLGSGIGKVVIPMHYTDFFSQVDGVELVKTLVDDSKSYLDLYSRSFNKNISNVKIYNDDFLNLDISDYDILISNTTIDENLRELLKDKISRDAKSGSIVISSIKSFKTDNLKEVRKVTTNFSWGMSTIVACIKDYLS